MTERAFAPLVVGGGVIAFRVNLHSRGKLF